MTTNPHITIVFAQSSETATSVEINSIWDFVVRGGPVMVPIGICSLVALTLVIERLITLRRRAIVPSAFPSELEAALQSGGRHAALQACERDGSSLARVFAAGVKRLGQPVETVERAMQEAGERESIRLRKHLRALALIGSISTLLGLLGTITGMITAFQTVATSGEALGRTELLAKGIYEAMITTAAGLIVAIPVQICYHWLASKVDRLVQAIDLSATEFVDRHVAPFAGTSVGAARSSGADPSQNGQAVEDLTGVRHDVGAH